MKRKFAVFALLCSAGLLLNLSPASAADGVLRVTLNGANEVPPGDPNGTGTATIFVDDDTNQICLIMRWRNVDGTYSGLHIHKAPAGQVSGVLIGFDTPPTPSSFTFQCRTVADEATLDDLVSNPAGHYLNLHSTPNFGPGAIRGQLRSLA